MIQVFPSSDNEYLTQYIIYNTKFVQKPAFTFLIGPQGVT